MSDEQKTTREKPRAPFADMPFAAMMEQMMGQQGCGCMEMMSQMVRQQDMDCDCAEMMPQMMAMCGGAQDEEEKNTPEETTQEA